MLLPTDYDLTKESTGKSLNKNLFTKKCICYNRQRLPVLWKNSCCLIRCKQLLQHIAKKLAPPRLRCTDAHQQHTSMCLRLACSVHAQTTEKWRSKGRRKCCVQCGRDVWNGGASICHTKQCVEQKFSKDTQFVHRSILQQCLSDTAVNVHGSNNRLQQCHVWGWWLDTKHLLQTDDCSASKVQLNLNTAKTHHQHSSLAPNIIQHSIELQQSS